MSSPLDPRELRSVLGSFVTGVTVVTTRDARGVGHGVTVNSFTSVSLEPPLVLWCQALSCRSFAAFRDSSHFAVNVLAHDQVGLSEHFARSVDNKLDGIEHVLGEDGVPLLMGTVAQLECVKVVEHPGGDHVVHIGRVLRMANRKRAPLVFARGRYELDLFDDE